MTIQEVHERLATRFPDSVLPLQTPEAGEQVIQVVADSLRDVCLFLRDDPAMQFDFLRLISGVDRKDCLSSVYHLFSYSLGHAVVIRVDISREQPTVPTVTDLWPAAEWHEREAFDMMGIIYEGHRNLKRILLPDDWQGFPLRKDYAAPAEYNGLTNT